MRSSNTNLKAKMVNLKNNVINGKVKSWKKMLEEFDMPLENLQGTSHRQTLEQLGLKAMCLEIKNALRRLKKLSTLSLDY